MKHNQLIDFICAHEIFKTEPAIEFFGQPKTHYIRVKKEEFNLDYMFDTEINPFLEFPTIPFDDPNIINIWFYMTEDIKINLRLKKLNRL